MTSGTMQMGRMAAVALVALLAGCGSGSMDGPGLGTSLRQAATQIVKGRLGGGRAAPAAPADPRAMAAEAMRLNPGPLLLVEIEGLGPQVLAMTGENQGKRTYMTKGQQAFIMRSGMVLGTRGFGNDLSVTEPGTEGLIRAGRSGTASRTMRWLEGDGREHAIGLTCTVTPASGRVVEVCAAGTLRVENTYAVSGGAITASRQWLGPKLGYAMVQTLRP